MIYLAASPDLNNTRIVSVNPVDVILFLDTTRLPSVCKQISFWFRDDIINIDQSEMEYNRKLNNSITYSKVEMVC